MRIKLTPKGLVLSASSLGFLVCCFLWVAFYSGYPILFFDTTWYLGDAFYGNAPRDKGFSYGYFIWIASKVYSSMWSIVFAQSVVVVLLLWDLVGRLVPRSSRLIKVVLISLLAILTPLPWVVSVAMPDFLSAVLLISFLILLVRPPEDPLCRIVIYAISGFSFAAHNTHLAIVGSALTIIFVLFWFIQTDRIRPLKLIFPMIAFAAGILTAGGLKYHRSGRVFETSSVGLIYFTHRLIEDGLMQKFLNEKCPTINYVLCPYRSELKTDQGFFMWTKESPLYKIGGWETPKIQLAEMIVDSIKFYPQEHLKLAAAHFWRQMYTFNNPEFIFNLEGYEYLNPGMAESFPEEREVFRRSLQENGELEMPWAGTLQLWVAAISAVVCFMLCLLARHPYVDEFRALCLFVFVYISVNAFVCGVFSHPEARYQGRVIWVVPFLALVGLVRIFHQPSRFE